MTVATMEGSVVGVAAGVVVSVCGLAAGGVGGGLVEATGVVAGDGRAARGRRGALLADGDAVVAAGCAEDCDGDDREGERGGVGGG